ncbi:hypothetical protein DL98DRAFT_533372 [Cadophora sp. DSE1049]|nr:hypothetical protein DL98DRAFT_533372 [Cadophora sp. DSE1049]
MCWEKRIQFTCGCEEVQHVRFCEWAAMPWLTNVAHPKGLPMQPTIDILPVKRECENCAAEKGKGKGVGGLAGEKKEGGKEGKAGKGKEGKTGKEGGKGEDEDEDAEGEELDEDELRAMIGEGYTPDQLRAVSGFWGSLGAPVGVGGSAAAAAGVRGSLVPVPEEDEDEDDEEGGARIS